MGKRLRVGNLGFAIDATKLGEIFAPFGSVASVKIVEDQYSGKSRGFGYIEMTNEEEALQCISQLHGKEHDGRTLTVAEAPPEKGRAKRSAK